MESDERDENCTMRFTGVSRVDTGEWVEGRRQEQQGGQWPVSIRQKCHQQQEINMPLSRCLG
jgi:hypothetical protein